MRASRFLIAALALAAAIAGQWKLDGLIARAAENSAAARSAFSEFPATVGRWRMTPVELAPSQVEMLGVDDYLRADFGAADGYGDLSVYAGYYKNPDRATQHPPTICYPGSGWLKTYEGGASLKVFEDGRRLAVQETVFEQEQQKTLVAYWYSITGYAGADASWYKVARLRRVLSGKALAGAMKVQIAMPVETTRQDAEVRLTSFVLEFLPVLKGFEPRDPSEVNSNAGQSK